MTSWIEQIKSFENPPALFDVTLTLRNFKLYLISVLETTTKTTLPQLANT